MRPVINAPVLNNLVCIIAAGEPLVFALKLNFHIYVILPKVLGAGLFFLRK